MTPGPMSATAIFRDMRSAKIAFPPCLLVCVAVLAGAAEESQRPIARVQCMAKVPEPLVVRDWPQVSRQYYDRLPNPATHPYKTRGAAARTNIS